MLAKAVQNHHPVSANKHTIQTQCSRTIVDALKPSLPTSLNASRPSYSAISNPLKRPIAQASIRDSFHKSHDQRMGRSASPGIYQLSKDGGRVGKLHDTVYFDENDFEDEATIGLDLSKPFLSTSTNHGTISYPALPSEHQVVYPQLSSSTNKTDFKGNGTQIPWSSSPMNHRLASPTQPATIPSQKKSRKLPWEGENEERRSPGLAAPAHSKSYTDRQRTKKSERQDEPNIPRLSTKDHSFSQYSWDSSATALKEEHKRLRLEKKSLSRNAHVEETINQPVPSGKKATVTPVFLSEEQKRVLKLVVDEQKSVFFTGSAGTGKSVLLREIIKSLRSKWRAQPDRVAVTASTGLAACNVGGVTVHSFAGIGLGKDDTPELVKKIKRNLKAKNRWLRTKILIVDEISMVDGELFDKLESIARSVRGSGRPFGGIQLVITGDFFQLPPVPDYGKVAKFCFDAATWTTSIEHTIGLTKVFRQKDPTFANMLNEMRLGKLTSQSIEAFRKLDRPISNSNNFEATELFPTRQEVDSANNNRMQSLVGKSYEFKADDGGSMLDRVQRDKLLGNCMAPASITLKKGAQVMLIKNFDETLVNGSVGRVVSFMDEKTFDIYHDNEEEFQAVETMDLNDEEMSRSRKKLKAMINKDLVGSTAQIWPLVRFSLPDGTFRELLCHKESWKIELPNGEVQASRSQVPLILAWALSIHKAQGQTLERVKVDLGKIFEKGQAYVALSRATCQEGLQILRFDPRKVMVHDKVRRFYDSLYSVDGASVSALRGGEVDSDVARSDVNSLRFR